MSLRVLEEAHQLLSPGGGQIVARNRRAGGRRRVLDMGSSSGLACHRVAARPDALSIIWTWPSCGDDGVHHQGQAPVFPPLNSKRRPRHGASAGHAAAQRIATPGRRRSACNIHRRLAARVVVCDATAPSEVSEIIPALISCRSGTEGTTGGR